MSDQPSHPPGESPKEKPNPPPHGRTSFSDPVPTQHTSPFLNGTMRPMGPSDDEWGRERRPRRCDELARQTPYRHDWDRSRSRSPTRSSPPVRMRDDDLLLGLAQRSLPPLSDMPLSPSRGVQSRESSIRSTAHASPPGVASLSTPSSRDASEYPPPRNASRAPTSPPEAASLPGLFLRPVSDYPPPRNASHTHAPPPGVRSLYTPHWREALGYPPLANASRAPPSSPERASLPPLDWRDASEYPLPRNAPRPLRRLPAPPMPVDFNPFTAPDPTPRGLGTQHQETSPGAVEVWNSDDAHNDTGGSVKDNKAKDGQEEDKQNLCEFSSPCNMDPSPDGMHFRKVISHIFGRNKSSTKLFPDWVWVQYCRKHYQRARYRADQWPFTQCELILESLDRMKRWDGVKSFELILRRRELLRLEEAESSQRRAAGSSGLLPSGRKHPTAVVAPVPDWLRARRGQEMSFDALRNLIVEIRNYMVQLRAEEKKREASEASDAKSKAKGKDKGDAKGNDKKPGEIRKQASCVRFPDVEILPRFRQWVIDDALRNRQASKKRVTKASDDKKGKDKKGKKGSHQAQHQAGEKCDESNENGENGAPTREAGGASSVGPSNAEPSDEEFTLSDARRRRSERIFVRTIEKNSLTTRVSSHGSVKKPRKKEE